MKDFLQLVLNPGSTSTKLAVFSNMEPAFTETLRHSSEELAKFSNVIDQFGYRRELVLGALQRAGIKPGELDAVVGRGGLLKPIPGGTYLVNSEMIKDLKTEHSRTAAYFFSHLVGHSLVNQGRFAVTLFHTAFYLHRVICI
ncbi:MAG: hypothetical protein M1609_04425, partial [Firmicutes bacterium]|nr:hypothetical protein [Bacillota bacterium]